MSRAGLAALALACCVTGCPEPEPPAPPILDCPEDAGVALTSLDVYAAIHSQICMNCHYPGGQAPSMSSLEALEALIDTEAVIYPPMRYLAPGDLRDSLMYLKVMGGTDAGYLGPNGEDTGALMPKGGPPLSDEQRELLRRWICQGAPVE